MELQSRQNESKKLNENFLKQLTVIKSKKTFLK